MRLFVAAYPSAEAIEDLNALVARLSVGRTQPPGRSVRLAPQERWHVTLAFLGDVPDDQQPVVHGALASAAEAWHADARPAPVLRVAGGGRFGRGRYTVLWTGLRGDIAGLSALAGAVRQRLRRARLPYDRKPFRPHMSLARPGDRLPAPLLAADLESIGGYEGPQWTIDAVELVRSHLGPQPRHDRIASWRI